MSDELDLMNTHFPTNNTRLIRPHVEFKQVRPGGPTHLYLDDEQFTYPVLWDSVNVQRRGSMNILTVSIVVGEVDMDLREPYSPTEN